jgi:Ca2+-binding RTX toxin-like protein
VQVTGKDSQGTLVGDEASSSHYGVNGAGIPVSGKILIGDNITDVVANQFNIVLVIDLSGSMAWAFNGSTNPPVGQSRLDFAKDAFKQFLDTSIFDSGIAANSVIRIAPFNGSFPIGDSRSPQTFNPNNYGTLAAFQAALNQKIDSLFAEGATQYEPPLRQTGQWFQSSEAIEQSEATNKIYFLSDGYDNDGYNIGSDVGLNNLYNGKIPHLDIQAFGFGSGFNSFKPDELDRVELGNGPVPPDVPTNWQTNNQADVAVVVNDDPSKLTDELNANSVSDAPTNKDTIVGGNGDEIIFGDNLIMDAASKAAFQATPTAEQFAFLKNYIQNTLLPGGTNFDAALFELNQSIGQSDNLSGGGGADIIFAQGGDDFIAGGPGNDLLVGGDGIDTFAYQALSNGADTIIDFENGLDRISFTALGVTAANFNTRVSINAIGSDTRISVDGNLLATLTGISSGIEQSDFILAG